MSYYIKEENSIPELELGEHVFKDMPDILNPYSQEGIRMMHVIQLFHSP